MHEAKHALPSTAGSLMPGSLHTEGTLFREGMSHQPRVLIGYMSKPIFLSQMAGWGDIPTGSKNNGLDQTKA